MTGTPWHEAPLVALDLEGSGAQDRDHEVILEIATVPIINAQPDVDHAYCALINPGRPIPARPWISPGLTNQTLRTAPTLETVGPALAEHLDGRYIVGHNVGVDWRLLHRRFPSIRAAGLIDTLRLARHLNRATSNGLARLIAVNNLAAKIDSLAIGSQPHRALWDTIAAAILLGALVKQAWSNSPTIEDLTEIAGTPLEGTPPAADQPSLFER
jgi:DNA polymerase III epsilon subunit-like protein